MRTEQLEREADYYGGENECFIHMEKIEGSNIKVITNGGTAGLTLAGFVLIQAVAETVDVSPEELMRFYRKMLKKHGRTKHSIVGVET